MVRAAVHSQNRYRQSVFDTVLQEGLGDPSKGWPRRGFPWEARWWLQLIQATSITFHVEGEQVTIPQSNGVRQGCPDSPVLFAAAIGEKMGATAEDFADPPG